MTRHDDARWIAGLCELCGEHAAQSTRKVDGETLAVCTHCLIAKLGD